MLIGLILPPKRVSRYPGSCHTYEMSTYTEAKKYAAIQIASRLYLPPVALFYYVYFLEASKATNDPCLNCSVLNKTFNPSLKPEILRYVVKIRNLYAMPQLRDVNAIIPQRANTATSSMQQKS